MTPDPVAAALDQLAAHDEQIAWLDHREAGHHTAITERLGELAEFIARIGRTVEEHAFTLTRSAQNGPDEAGADGYSPSPAPAWWRLAADGRQDPVARLRAWVEQVYRPGYGHLTATLGSCWESHDLCLYGLDILAELWSVLYLQPQRTAALLSAQAEYQARVLPAMADQFATGTPGPDVLDVDQHGPAGNGYAAYARLREAGLLDGASACVQTPSGGMHTYFTGSDQRNGHLPAHHLDFRSAGGYVLAPPSQIDERPYQLIGKPGGRGGLDWGAAVRLLEPQRQQQRSRQAESPGQDLTHLARWVTSQPERNRNAGLFWAANRALEADPAADLTPLADAARLAGLGDLEITRTLNSARRTGGPRLDAADYQPEAGDHT